MLELLHIENIAVIEEADIQFHPGFNALTGETGAGKSIVIGEGNSMPTRLIELVETKDKEKVELYKKLFPEFAKRLHEAKVAYLSKKDETKTIVLG